MTQPVPPPADGNRLRPTHGKEPPVTHQNDNIETPPAVESPQYEEPSTSEQRSFIAGTNLLILVLAIVFVAIILIYVFTR